VAEVRHRADRIALALVFVVVFGFIPAVFGWAALRLSGLADGTQGFASITGAIAVLAVAGMMIGGAFREVRGAIGIVVEAEGIRRRGQLVPFSAFDSAIEDQYGSILVRRGKERFRIATYLFSDQAAVTTHVLDHIPRPPDAVEAGAEAEASAKADADAQAEAGAEAQAEAKAGAKVKDASE
jgi:hypothetical protein